MRFSWLCLVLLVFGLVCTGKTQAQQPPLIAAASSLQFALHDIKSAFKDETGLDIRLTFGSSGNLARQIRQGAPYELFLAANESFPADLFNRGFSKNQGEVYALGQLALITPSASNIDGEAFLASQQSVEKIDRFSIANPEHAPYGIAAKTVLQQLGLWKPLEQKMVFGENVAQATQFVTSGNAEAGLISLSLTIEPALASRLNITRIPGNLHVPIVKRMIVLNNASDVTVKFKEFVLSPTGARLLTNHGFLTPEGEN